MHKVSRHRTGTQARCMGTRPGSEKAAKAHEGILESWESRTVLSCTSRTRTTPAHQRPGAWVALPAAHASETSEATREPTREGNRSARGQSGSRSGLIVAFQNRVTNRREPVSSEGDHQGEGVPIGETLGSFCPFKRLNPPVAISLRERILLFEEPDALIALVRVCGGLGGRPPGLPGDQIVSRRREAREERARVGLRVLRGFASQLLPGKASQSKLDLFATSFGPQGV
jgi:hypothetical protein